MKDDKLVKATGDPDSPTSRGYLCIKGKSAPELLYHPDRLKYPMKRAGARGENKWQRITWRGGKARKATTARELLDCGISPIRVIIIIMSNKKVSVI